MNIDNWKDFLIGIFIGMMTLYLALFMYNYGYDFLNQNAEEIVCFAFGCVLTWVILTINDAERLFED